MPDVAQRGLPERETRIAAPSPRVDIDSDNPARGARVIRCVVALMLYQGFTMAILGTGASWIAQSFGLGNARDGLHNSGSFVLALNLRRTGSQSSQLKALA